MVQLGLDPQYPRLGLLEASATARRCSPATSWPSSPCCELAAPFAMWPAFPASDYYGGSAPPRRHQPTADLPATGLAGRRGGRHPGGSHVHHATGRRGRCPVFPCSLATGTPQAFPVASWPAQTPASESPRCRARRALLPGPHPPGWSRFSLEGVPPLVHSSLHLPVSLAGPGPSGSADPSRRCRGCSHGEADLGVLDQVADDGGCGCRLPSRVGGGGGSSGRGPGGWRRRPGSPGRPAIGLTPLG